MAHHPKLVVHAVPDPDEHFRRFALEIERIAVMTRRQICRIFAKRGVKLIRVR